MHLTIFRIATATLAAAVTTIAAEPTPPVAMANGIKIGEVGPDSAIVWTRLTMRPERNLEGTPWQGGDNPVPDGASLADMQDAAPGAAGEVRVAWSLDGRTVGSTDWLKADPERDHTRQVRLTDRLDLEPLS